MSSPVIHTHEGSPTTVTVTVDEGAPTQITLMISPGVGYFVPVGGTPGQVLVKTATGFEWATVAGTGDVVGPASSVDGRLSVFDGLTGKRIAQAGITITDLLLLLPTSGNGSPEGVVARGPAVWYKDDATGDLYIKSSGTGNTGWTKFFEA